ncbi:hypothetical protein HWQ67_12520 [Candidatus Magnetobacterium casensis]|uniref:Uncharacterized protein n=1 Tax=Candidatus Magnetobacterium casense TaxID=1455061 RepID=A0ABS6S0M1_9BACT|nr:hypothetical protein [Candidatus Magnetobacterium casensis]
MIESKKESGQMSGQMSDKRPPEIEIELELESEKEKEEAPVPALAKPKFSQEVVALTQLLYDRIMERVNPTRYRHKKPGEVRKMLEGWAGDIDKLHRIDGVPHKNIAEMIEWCTAHDEGKFSWARNILSGEKLRAHFDTMEGQKNSGRRSNHSKEAYMKRNDAILDEIEKVKK